MRWFVVLVAVVVAGCQTTGQSAENNTFGPPGYEKFGVCDEMPIRTTSAVKPSRDRDCHVATGADTGDSRAFTMYYIHRGNLWDALVLYAESASTAYMYNWNLWRSLETQWPEIMGETRSHGRERNVQIDGVSYRAAEFEINDAHCLAFMTYGKPKGEGFDRKVMGYVCREGPRDRPEMETTVASFNTRDLLN